MDDFGTVSVNNMPASGACSLAEMVQPQPGAVVGRTFLRKRGGSVTVFAFSEGQGLTERTTSFDSLIFAIEGEAEIEIDGSAHLLRAGETIKIGSNVPYAVRTPALFKMMLVMLRP